MTVNTPMTASATPNEQYSILLWRKYQRRRVAWDMVQHIDDILAGKATNERRDRRNGKSR